MSSCDLLEKSYLCGINNNWQWQLWILSHVVICLKSLTFVVSITTQRYLYNYRYSCDLLEKSYLCGINNNLIAIELSNPPVVICLKSLTFVVSITTKKEIEEDIIGCDLLEKSYLCGINNNWEEWTRLFFRVVICLKSLTFVVSITTSVIYRSRWKPLWFAWKVLPLWYQ